MNHHIEKVVSERGTFLVDPKKDKKIYKSLKMLGTHQNNDLSMMLTFIKEGDIVFDIGAHIGTTSVPFSKKVGDKGHVFAFEPIKETYHLLTSNLDLNSCKNVTALNTALSSTKIKLSATTPSHALSGTSFRKAKEKETGDISYMASTIDSFAKEKLSNKKELVKFIKIDAEGHDFEIIKGGSKLISQYKPIVYFELNKRQLKKKFFFTVGKIDLFFRMRGYSFFKNLEERNSPTGDFTLAKIPTVFFGGKFGDVLAVHKKNPRYPQYYMSTVSTSIYLIKKKLKRIFNI